MAHRNRWFTELKHGDFPWQTVKQPDGTQNGPFIGDQGGVWSVLAMVLSQKMVRPCLLRPPTLVTRAVPPRCKARIHWVSYNNLTATSLEWWWVEVALPQCRYFRWNIMIRPDIIIQPETWSMLYEYVCIINMFKTYLYFRSWVSAGGLQRCKLLHHLSTLIATGTVLKRSLQHHCRRNLSYRIHSRWTLVIGELRGQNMSYQMSSYTVSIGSSQRAMLSLDVGWEVSLYFPAHVYVFVVQWGAPFHSLVHHFLYEELQPLK